MENPFTEPPPDCSGYNLIDNPRARLVSELFNSAYALMVEMLMRFFAHTDESEDDLKALAGTAMALMQRVLRPLGILLTTLPATAAGDVPRAGASFAFYRSIDCSPHRDAAWMLFDERLAELIDFSAAITGLEKVQTAIQALSAGLKPHLASPANRARR